MNKIKAVTILELMVVMLISMLVLGIAYQGYMLFFKQFSVFKDSSDKIAEVVLFDRLITGDFNDCKTVVRNEQGVECIFPDKVIQYHFADAYILRKRIAQTDTFYFNLENITFNFRDEPSHTGLLVDELVFTDKKNERHKTFHYIKLYAADVMVNNRDKENGRN